MSDGFKLSIFGNNQRSEKKRGKKAPEKHEAKDTAPKAAPVPVAEAVAASPESVSASSPLSASDPLLISECWPLSCRPPNWDAFFPSEKNASEKEAQGARRLKKLRSAGNRDSRRRRNASD